MMSELKPYDLTGKRVWVAGHRGMVGGAVVRRLQSEGCTVLTAGRNTLDLTRQAPVEEWVAVNKPDAVVVAAAKVGGIMANNSYPADFLYDNLMIETNIIQASFRNNVEKLLFLGSSCIYPKLAPQPMTEDALLTGPLEPTNEWYAIAKIAGIKLCQAYRKQHGCDYISAMPTNLYGIGDNFHPQGSHVLPALMARLHDAKRDKLNEVTIWGTGKPLREFLYVDDLADGLVFLLKNYSGYDHVNIGTGQEVSIRTLAEQVAATVGWQGRFAFDATKPDGSPRKLMDNSKLAKLGWTAKTSLAEGLRLTYEWFLEEGAKGGLRGI
ncbi:GDP-L-fucose synthase [Niveispirillum cyanobacteriorum]|uniref:GDP-L-fucose synthase n=1 Tax=Niveispirillum cyanobacteriorum TaxID=1612173 RepID=A0A2K9NL99_9PROT|nr:GDP-L-fucose synthase [Niveispirillum cyanobacteriorum]AUN33406.1 GDP-fucose synthetase [Niveispirillum cyanobacteriorum]GGE48892.1 GDP-L-fucose synthase [Niveispirillum cyanobacteriorum]